MLQQNVICTGIYTADLHGLNNRQIFAVTTIVWKSSAHCSPSRTDDQAPILMVRKEAFALIICFESKVSHVANKVPKGTPMLEVQTEAFMLDPAAKSSG